MEKGFIKIHRELEKWEWSDDLAMIGFLVRLILKANHEDRKWHGVSIKRGQFVCSRDKLSAEMGISPQKLRTFLKRLIDCGEVSKKSTSHFTVYTIVKYEKFQDVAKKSTNQQPTNNQPTTTTKEDKELKNKKENILKEKSFMKGKENEKLTRSQRAALALGLPHE